MRCKLGGNLDGPELILFGSPLLMSWRFKVSSHILIISLSS